MTQGATKLMDDKQVGSSLSPAPESAAEPERPRMPSPESAPRAEWEERARRFHRFGPADPKKTEPAQASDFDWSTGAPAALLSLRETRPGMPAVLIPGEEGERGSVQTLELVLERALETVRGAGHPARVLAEVLPRFVRRLSKRLRNEQLPVVLREVAGEEMDSFIADLALSGESGQSLSEDAGSLLSTIPLSWRIFGPSVAGEHVAIECLRRAREPARNQVALEARSLVEHVDNLLLLDRAKGSSKGLFEGIRDGLGQVGTRHIDPEMLARLHPDRQANRLKADRRKRLEKASKVLGDWLRKIAEEPLPIHLVGESESLSISTDEVPAGVIVQHEDRPLRAAADIFAQAALPVVELARAIRVARLEMAGAYRSEVHDGAIETLDWQALKPEEIALVPPVVAVVNHRSVVENEIGDLCRLVWSGRPVLVVASAASPDPDELADLSRHQPSLGTLLVAMHHAWVLQTSSARPAHMGRGLLDSDPRRPSMALIARPKTALAGEAAVAGRAWPLFVFQPAEGGGRLDLGDNHCLDSDWPTYAVEVRKGKEPGNVDLSVTFAEAAAALSTGQDHLLPIPVEGWDEGQIPLHEWIFHPSRDKPGGPLPFIWLLAGDGSFFRAIVSRALALATTGRLRDFRLLQEMAGVGGPNLARARKEAREQAQAEAELEQARLRAERDEAVEAAAAEAAGAAMSKLAAALLADGGLGALTTASTGVPSPSPAREDAAGPEAKPPPAPEPEEEDEEEALLLDPWINTPLCTSCNDCFKINELLFRYDENKQAVFTDLSKGTYADLVRAAEICPAKCIHPGKPRPDDPTATPDMVARGAKL